MALLDKNILNQKNKEDLEKVKMVLAEEGLNWTWESIHYTLFEQNIDWESLRVYDGKFKNIIIILLAGMANDKRDKAEAFRILTKFSELGIHPMRLHKFLVEVLQERHFFTDTEEEELTQNLIEADLTDQITLRNLIYSLILKETARESLQLMKDSSKKEEKASTKQ